MNRILLSLMLCLAFILSVAGCASGNQAANKQVSAVEELFSMPDAAMGGYFLDSDLRSKLKSEGGAIGGLISYWRDASCARALVYLSETSPEDYPMVGKTVQAEVLVAAMRDAEVLDDFGVLISIPDTIGDSGRLLLDVGEEAIPELVPLLDDFRFVRLDGSGHKSAMLGDYRRADYAYYYIMKILGKEYKYTPNSTLRMWRCLELKSKLMQQGKEVGMKTGPCLPL